MERIEIAYERKISGSYMKITTDEKEGLDERMLLRQSIPGILPLEKCFVNGETQYWYDISGKQSLDTFCRVKPIGQMTLEQLIHSICEVLGLLERHLIDTDCLCLTSETIYILISTGEMIFTAIPGKKTPVTDEFRELAEYFLTQVDHKDPGAVRLVYDIYEKALEEGYHILDIESSIIRSHLAEDGTHLARNESAADADMWPTPPAKERAPVYEKKEFADVKTAPDAGEAKKKANLYEKVNALLKRVIGRLTSVVPISQSEKTPVIRPQKEETQSWRIIYPDEEAAEDIHEQLHPTVCLSDVREHPDGLLLYEGFEDFPNVRLEKTLTQIGQSAESDIVISKKTISRFHARIEQENKDFFLEDLNSTNGTFVNEELLAYKERRKLAPNDRIRFADVTYRLV